MSTKMLISILFVFGMAGIVNAYVVSDDFNSYADGTALGDTPNWYSGSGSNVVTGGIVGSASPIVVMSKGPMLDANRVKWTELAVGDSLSISMDFQTSSDSHKFDDDRLGMSNDYDSTTSNRTLGAQLEQYHIETYFNNTGDTGERIILSNSDFTDLPVSTWYTFNVTLTKLGDFRVLIETSLRAVSDNSLIASGSLDTDTLDEAHRPHHKYFTDDQTADPLDGGLWPMFKNYNATSGNADNFSFEIIQPVEIWREAEAADTLTSPYEVLTDPDASSGKYINAKPGTAFSTSASPAPDGTASFIFDASEGTYKVALRVKIIEGVNSYDNDSLWVRMDSGNWIRFNDISHAGNVWHWVTVHDSDNGKAIVEFTLADGQHVLEISYRETNCLIDAVLITNNPELDDTTLPDVIPVYRPDAALIVNSDDLMSGFDAAQYDRLKTLGYNVAVYTGDEVKEDPNDPNALTVAIAETFDVLVISSSVNPGDVNELADVNVPVMAEGSWTNLGYTSDEGALADVNMVNLIDANNPAVADANLVTGPMQFFTNVTSTNKVDIAALPASAMKLVQIADSNDVIVFAIEFGKTLIDPNAVAADRIVGFSLPGQDMMDANQLTDGAWALYDAAIAWLNPGLDLLDGIVAYYPLDGDANDISGNGLDGTLSVRGAATNAATFVDGISGQAIDLLPDSGETGPYVACPNDAMFNLEEAVSVSVWVKIRSLPDQYSSIVVKGEESWRLMTDGASSKMHFGIANYGARPVHALIGATDLAMDEWYHVCGTYDINTGATLYINGVVDGTLEDHLGIQQNTEPVWIGADSNATWKPGRCFDGQIDEVMIYDRALTPKEINTLAGN